MGEAGRGRIGGERIIAGIPAAHGLVIGRIARDESGANGTRQAGNPADETAALRQAIGLAAADLDRLIASQDELAGDILEFQKALLEDGDLIGPILATVAAGRAAHDAWADALDAEIAEYRHGGDEYMSARAEDLCDLKTRVLRALYGAGSAAGVMPESISDAILVADELTPSRFLELDWQTYRGAAIRTGSRTSHVAILARARGVPLVVGLASDLDSIAEGVPAVLDAAAGRLIVSPSPATLSDARGRIESDGADARAAAQALDQEAMTADGERIQVLINVDDPSILRGLSPDHCDGIGLTRTEFLFQGGHLPDEDTQFAAYRAIVNWAAGRPATIRTLDAGGDKPIPGVTPEGEANPFLGVRGLRLSLRHLPLFRTQLRALARAAALGPVKIMVPMVTIPDELARVRALVDEVIAGLRADGVAHAAPALGMMVEVPAAALTAADFDADFYSIGSNDLVQYVTATARDASTLAELADPLNPAVLELIRRTVDAARERGVEVSLCGDMASEPGLVGALLDCGLRTLSVAPAQVGRVKLAIRRHATAGAVP